METAQDSIKTKIIATIDHCGLITFRNAEAIEGIGIRDEFNNYYDAGIGEDFTVYAGNVVDTDNSIFTGENNDEKIPQFKVGQKLLLLCYYNDAEDSQVGLEIQAIFDNWQAFEQSEAFKTMNYYKQYTIFVPINQFIQTGWNGFLF